MSLHISNAAERELVGIMKEHGNNPNIVVDKAKAADNPLHKYFEWNVEKAARAHNLEIARAMIRTVRIVKECTDRGVVRIVSIPKFVSDPSDRGNYRTVESVIGRTRIERDVVTDTLNEIASAKGHLERALAIGLALGCADDIREAVATMVWLAVKVRGERKAAA